MVANRGNRKNALMIARTQIARRHAIPMCQLAQFAVLVLVQNGVIWHERVSEGSEVRLQGEVRYG